MKQVRLYTLAFLIRSASAKGIRSMKSAFLVLLLISLKYVMFEA